MQETILQVNAKNFKKEVLESEIPVVADFWAQWCMPCRMIAPAIDELSKENEGKIKFVKVNVDDNAELATNLRILSIPALIIFNEGKEIKRITGANPKETIKNEIESALA